MNTLDQIASDLDHERELRDYLSEHRVIFRSGKKPKSNIFKKLNKKISNNLKKTGKGEK